MELKTIKKKILYKSKNRGIKEMDFLLEKFVKNNIEQMTMDQLNKFELLLEESDIDIFNWITNKNIVPNRHNNEVFRMIHNMLNQK